MWKINLISCHVTSDWLWTCYKRFSLAWDILPWIPKPTTRHVTYSISVENCHSPFQFLSMSPSLWLDNLTKKGANEQESRCLSQWLVNHWVGSLVSCGADLVSKELIILIMKFLKLITTYPNRGFYMVIVFLCIKSFSMILKWKLISQDLQSEHTFQSLSCPH